MVIFIWLFIKRTDFFSLSNNQLNSNIYEFTNQNNFEKKKQFFNEIPNCDKMVSNMSDTVQSTCLLSSSGVGKITLARDKSNKKRDVSKFILRVLIVSTIFYI
jgi:hypothetical protein